MKRLLTCALLALFTTHALAADAVLSWTHPTQYTDGTPIPSGALTQTSIIYGKCNATNSGLLASPAPVTVTAAFPATTRTITGLGDGNWCFAARSETAAAQSAFTPFVFKSIVLIPNPPVLNSTITLAYETWRFLGKTYLGRYVGNISLGTPCGAAIAQVAGKTYYEIPRDSVTLFKQPNAGPLVTQCAAG